MSNCLAPSGGVAYRSSRLKAGAAPPRCLRLADDRMRRRDLLVLLGGIRVSWPLATRAQQKIMPVVGWLQTFPPPANLGDLGRGPIHQGLSEIGFVEGQNMMTEYHWAEGHYDRLPALAADLVSRKVDLIIANNGTPPALAAKNATSTIPIVFILVSDPVGIGLVASLARPGGNVTGFTNIVAELMPKRVELLTELGPWAKVVALLVDPQANNPATEASSKTRRRRRARRGSSFRSLKAGTEGEIETAFASLGELQAGGLVVGPDEFFNTGNRRAQVVALAARYAVPAVYAQPQFPAAGGLISYAIDDGEQGR
jgi:putative tryptophan/tyrosine transport system substrate-binding protein